MKKIFLLLLTCCLSLTMSAKVAYLVPGKSNDKGEIPAQWDNHTFEHTAYDWFKTEYVDKGLGDFINFTNIPSNKDTYSAIWIYIDREWKQSGEPWDEGRMDALFNDGVVNALKTYAQNGGNLFLGKQAARLAYRMGRIGYAPKYECGGYSQDDRFWGIKAKLGSSLSAENQRDRSDHAIYAGLATARMDNVDGCFPLLNSVGDAHSTDNNIHWVEYWTPNGEGGWRKNPDNNGDPALIDGWESYWNARALGTWTSIGDYCVIQAVEFMPKDAFTGTILTINIGAYQWNSESTGDAANNVKKLTKNALFYLSGVEVIWTQTPGDAAVMEYKDPAKAVCNVEGATVSYRSLDTDVIEINGSNGALTYKAPAPEGVMVEAYTTINETEYKAQHLTKVFAPLADWVVRPAKTNVLVGEDIEIDGKVRYGAATFGFKVDNDYCDCTYNEETKKYTLHFKHAGTTIVRPIATAYGAEYENNETGGEPITFTISPDLKWTTYPQSAFVGEQNKVAEATSNEGTVVYSSSDDTKVSVDSEGNLTFLGYDEACVVTITATVTIGGQNYSISGNVNANLPNVMWTKEPKTTAYLNETMDIAAQLQYWVAHEVLFETTNCTYDSETKELTITGENATVQPYVLLTAANKRYNGELKNITVTAPAVTWAKDGEDHDMVPENAAILEEKYKRTPKAVCNVPGLTVKYRSADPTKISINETTGALQYLAPTAGDGIDITAYVTVGGTEYSISHTTKCLKPTVEWVNKPAATGVVGLDMAYGAKVKFGDATIGYDYTKCSDVDGKLHFAAAGTAIVRPYAIAYDVKYYDDEVLDFSIEVAEPTFTWVTDPSNAAVTEDKPAVNITVNNGMTVLYASSDERVATVADDGKLTYRHAGETTITGYIMVDEVKYESEGKAAEVSGMTVIWDEVKVPEETAFVKDEVEIAAAPVYGSAKAQFKTVNCDYNPETGKLTFNHAGTATVLPYVEGYDGEKFDGDLKTIAVSPDMYWENGDPDVGCVGETGKNAIAVINAGTTVYPVYTSSNSEYISIDEHTGALTFHKVTETDVTITATVTIDGKKYTLTGVTQAQKPIVKWYKAPATNATVGEVLTLGTSETNLGDMFAHVVYGPTETQYDASECFQIVDGKLHFTQAGTATISPYMEFEGEKYYGDAKTVTVAPLKTIREVSSTYSTICLPYEATYDASVVKTVYTMAGVLKDGVDNILGIMLETYEAATLEAGMPYLFSTDATSGSHVSVEFNQFGLRQDEPQMQNGMIGTYEDITITADQNDHYGYIFYLATDNMLHRIMDAGRVKIGATKAYFDLYEAAPAEMAPGRVMMPIQGVSNAPTGTETVGDPMAGMKFLRNGRIHILRNGRLYDEVGRLLK